MKTKRHWIALILMSGSLLQQTEVFAQSRYSAARLASDARSFELKCKTTDGIEFKAIQNINENDPSDLSDDCFDGRLVMSDGAILEPSGGCGIHGNIRDFTSKQGHKLSLFQNGLGLFLFGTIRNVHCKEVIK